MQDPPMIPLFPPEELEIPPDFSSREPRLFFTADTERIGDAIDVVEPRGDQRDLQDAAIVEAGVAQPNMIARAALRGILGNFDHVFQHGFILLANGCGAKIALQGLHHGIIQGNATQKLCVRLDSIMAMIGDRNHRCDHFLLIAAQRQFRRK